MGTATRQRTAASLSGPGVAGLFVSPYVAIVGQCWLVSGVIWEKSVFGVRSISKGHAQIACRGRQQEDRREAFSAACFPDSDLLKIRRNANADFWRAGNLEQRGLTEGTCTHWKSGSSPPAGSTPMSWRLSGAYTKVLFLGRSTGGRRPRHGQRFLAGLGTGWWCPRESGEHCHLPSVCCLHPGCSGRSIRYPTSIQFVMIHTTPETIIRCYPKTFISILPTSTPKRERDSCLGESRCWRCFIRWHRCFFRVRGLHGLPPVFPCAFSRGDGLGTRG